MEKGKLPAIKIFCLTKCTNYAKFYALQNVQIMPNFMPYKMYKLRQISRLTKCTNHDASHECMPVNTGIGSLQALGKV